MLHASRLKTDAYSHTKPIQTLVWNIADHLIGALYNINYFLKTHFLFYSFFTFKLLKCKNIDCLILLILLIKKAIQSGVNKVEHKFRRNLHLCMFKLFINFHKRKEKHFCILIAWLKNKNICWHFAEVTVTWLHIICYKFLLNTVQKANFLQFNQVQIFCLIESTAFSFCFSLYNLSEIVYN